MNEASPRWIAQFRVLEEGLDSNWQPVNRWGAWETAEPNENLCFSEDCIFQIRAVRQDTIDEGVSGG